MGGLSDLLQLINFDSDVKGNNSTPAFAVNGVKLADLSNDGKFFDISQLFSHILCSSFLMSTSYLTLSLSHFIK